MPGVRSSSEDAELADSVDARRIIAAPGEDGGRKANEESPLARAGAKFFFGGNALAARISWALAASAVYAAAGIPANTLAAHHASAGDFLAQAGRDAGVVQGLIVFPDEYV